jgi:ABC-type nitrate/sulfonate/bicarbonate transport system ATPase subunit
MATGPGINIRIDRKQFGSAHPLFESFELDVAAGSVVALSGPSGIGKSTLLRILAGVDRDFDGCVDINGAPAHLRPAPGLVTQDARLLPWLTVAGNLRAVAPWLSQSEVDKLLIRVGMEGTDQLFSHQLSGGMQRRVAFARALAVSPSLLLLDEPFVSLDPSLTEQMVALLQDVVATSAPTVVLVTHVIEDVTRLSDKIVELRGRPARVLASDTGHPMALYANSGLL